MEETDSNDEESLFVGFKLVIIGALIIAVTTFFSEHIRMIDDGGAISISIIAVLMILGLVPYFKGFHRNLRRKRYPVSWVLLGILGLIGMVILLLLPDKTRSHSH